MPLAIGYFLLFSSILDFKNVTCSRCAFDLVREPVNVLVEGYNFLSVFQYGDFNDQADSKKEKGEGSIPLVSPSQRFHSFGLCKAEEHQVHASITSFLRSIVFEEDRQRDGDSIHCTLEVQQCMQLRKHTAMHCTTCNMPWHLVLDRTYVHGMKSPRGQNKEQDPYQQSWQDHSWQWNQGGGHQGGNPHGRRRIALAAPKDIIRLSMPRPHRCLCYQGPRRVAQLWRPWHRL